MRNNMSKWWSCKNNQDMDNFTSTEERTTKTNEVWVDKQIRRCALTWKSSKYTLKAHCKCLPPTIRYTAISKE